MKKFSIITVCFNAEQDIEKTIMSVLNLASSDFEYLIKDGLSNDRTVEIAESLAPAFAEKHIAYRIISQKDSGIYDAMNQAIQQAEGEWVIFMNSGDRFADRNLLNLLEKRGCLETEDIIYGDTIFSTGIQYCYKKALPLEEIRFKMPFCHQSTVTKKVLFIDTPYSTHYRICSDYEFFLKMYSKKKRYMYIPVAFSIYDDNGISSDWHILLQERIKILEAMPERDEQSITRTKNILNRAERNAWWHRLILKIIPLALQKKRRELIRRKENWKTEEEILMTNNEALKKLENTFGELSCSDDVE